MLQQDIVKLECMSYDPTNDTAHFTFSGWREGRPTALSGFVKIPLAGNLLKDDIGGACAKELAAFLHEVADNLYQPPAEKPAAKKRAATG